MFTYNITGSMWQKQLIMEMVKRLKIRDITLTHGTKDKSPK